MRQSIKDIKADHAKIETSPAASDHIKDIAAPVAVPAASMGPAASQIDILPAADPGDVIQAAARDLDGEPVPAEILPADDLPADIGSTIDDLLADYMQRFKIDDMKKATASQWRGACLVVGDYIRRSGITLDPSRKNPVNNIPCYNTTKVYKLFDAWQLLCLAYDKAPLCADFVAFSGCSDRWFYNDNGHEVSSAGTSIYKKLLEIQQSGLSSRLVDGRINPTGTIFFLKNWHGWRDQREVIHTAGGSSVGADSLPLLGGPGGSDGNI